MRTFTLDEAQWLLPTLRDVLKRAMHSKQTIDQVNAELGAVNQRIFLLGGMLPDLAHLSRQRAMRDTAVQAAQDALGEIQAMGVQVKDLDKGLLDFPCDLGDETILLCWKDGEDEITHYHGMEEGFAGRKPITDAIRAAGSGRSH